MFKETKTHKVLSKTWLIYSRYWIFILTFVSKIYFYTVITTCFLNIKWKMLSYFLILLFSKIVKLWDKDNQYTLRWFVLWNNISVYERKKIYFFLWMTPLKIISATGLIEVIFRQRWEKIEEVRIGRFTDSKYTPQTLGMISSHTMYCFLRTRLIQKEIQLNHL